MLRVISPRSPQVPCPRPPNVNRASGSGLIVRWSVRDSSVSASMVPHGAGRIVREHRERRRYRPWIEPLAGEQGGATTSLTSPPKRTMCRFTHRCARMRKPTPDHGHGRNTPMTRPPEDRPCRALPWTKPAMTHPTTRRRGDTFHPPKSRGFPTAGDRRILRRRARSTDDSPWVESRRRTSSNRPAPRDTSLDDLSRPQATPSNSAEPIRTSVAPSRIASA